MTFRIAPFPTGNESMPTQLAQCPGFVSCKKKNRNAKNKASAGARAYMGVWGGAPSGVQGQSPWSGGEAPLQLKAFYCRREQICHSHLSET